jgi:hypothetical protein
LSAGASAFAFAFAALVLCACRSESRTTPGADAGAKGPVLSLRSASHDFGQVDEGARLVHVFHADNRGDAALRLEPVTPAFGCSPEAWTVSQVPPGGSASLRVSCDTERRAGALAVELLLASNDPTTPAAKLHVRARVEPRLAFDALVAGLETDFGTPLIREVRLRGKFASAAKLSALVLEKRDPMGPRVEILPSDATRPMGLRFTLDARRVADGAGGVRVATDVEGRDPLALSFTYRVRGFMDVTPSRPYVNLRDGTNRVSVLVSSRRPDFELQRVEIVEGPFRAELGEHDPGRGRSVRVYALPERIRDVDRGALGRLLLVSNDPAEPAKEVPLFALGVRREPGARP